jgi:N-acetylated-alpha-linked acidic dipeptidase
MNSRGALDVEGSHSLQYFISQVARDVRDPETGASVLERAIATRRVAGYEAGRVPDTHGGLQLDALGSGSDYTPFLQHLGINSLNVEFHGESEYGVYHSAYDSFDHFRRFVDPTFQYGIALAQVTGRVVLRAAQAELLPAQQSDFADSLAAYDEDLHQLTDGMRAKARELDTLLDDDAFRFAADPRLPRAAPSRAEDVPDLNFVELDNAIERLRSSAKAFDGEYRRVAVIGDAHVNPERARLNATIAGLEQALTDPHGLPGREWYQHMIYAPGLHTGYGVKTLPGIREAIEARRWEEAGRYIGVVAHALNAYSARLDRAIAPQ